MSEDRVVAAATESRLVREGEPLLVLVSGGGDSVCLLDLAVRLGADTRALHVNYGLRDGADADEQLCRELCDDRGVPLAVESVRLPERGNLQSAARQARYGLAERATAGDYAAAHTASDQAETVLYRLAVSPGSRALLGMGPRRGRLVRPLLAVTREEVRGYLAARGLSWREDPTNADRRFARARVRADALASLRTLSPAVDRTIAETASQLREEAEVLDIATTDALEALGGGPAVSLHALCELPAALRRLVVRRLAETEVGSPRSLSRRESEAICSLGPGGTKTLDLGEGLRAVAEYGMLRLVKALDAAPPRAVELSVPGRARFGSWEVEARVGGPGDVAVAGAALGPRAVVRSWREGDRMRPIGLGGSKTLQDLFTDRKVPRSLRSTLPVVEADGAIVWVAGVALDERFAARDGDGGAVGLSARSLG